MIFYGKNLERSRRNENYSCSLLLKDGTLSRYVKSGWAMRESVETKHPPTTTSLIISYILMELWKPIIAAFLAYLFLNMELLIKKHPVSLVEHELCLINWRVKR